MSLFVQGGLAALRYWLLSLRKRRLTRLDVLLGQDFQTTSVKSAFFFLALFFACVNDLLLLFRFVDHLCCHASIIFSCLSPSIMPFNSRCKSCSVRPG